MHLSKSTKILLGLATLWPFIHDLFLCLHLLDDPVGAESGRRNRIKRLSRFIWNPDGRSRFTMLWIVGSDNHLHGGRLQE